MTAVPLLAAVVLVSEISVAKAQTVDCRETAGPPNPIELALNGQSQNLLIMGTCVGPVTVAADDVRIYGFAVDGEDAIVGQVTVDGAQRFRLQDLRITTGADDEEQIGIYVIGGASAQIWNVVVEDTQDSGIDVRFGSFARVMDSTIRGNVWGLSVGIGGVVDGLRNTIEENDDIQVDIYQHGTYRGTRETIIGEPTGPQPSLALSAARLSHVDLRRQTRIVGDIDASLGSHLRLRGQTQLTGDIRVDSQTTVDVADGSAVEGNIETQNLSIVRVLGDATVDGTVRCYRTSVCMED